MTVWIISKGKMKGSTIHSDSAAIAEMEKDTTKDLRKLFFLVNMQLR